MNNRELTPPPYDREKRVFLGDRIWRFIRPLAIILCVMLATFGIAMSVWNHIERSWFAPMDEADLSTVAFQVKSGESLTKVAEHLAESGLIHNATVFKYYADFAGYSQKIQSGDYALSKSMPMTEIANQLTLGDGNPLVRNITVIPGWTVEKIAEYLQQIGQISSSAEFLRECQTGENYTAYYYISDIARTTGRRYMLEGYLMPDTYEVYTSATSTDIIRKLLSQTEAVFTDSDHARADEIGMTMDEVLTLASMIEKEAKEADFKKVSAVFHNRLDIGMTLGSDATVKYASGVTRLSLNGTDLGFQSPYNTYIYKGLPPGPICSPSKAAISAALYPDETFISERYLYFCTKEPSSGELAFAKTLEEHERNVSIYSPLWQAYDLEHANGNP